MTVRADVAELLRQGLSNAEIARRLNVDRHAVGNARRALGLPNVPLQPLSLEQKWESHTRPVEGGHLEWTGETNSVSGTPIMRYRGKGYTAARIAFRIQHGREPEGYAYADCGLQHCVAPRHVGDETTRLQTREQLRYLTGGTERPAHCRHGHDQAKHGKYEPDGVAYCGACKRERRTGEQQAVA